jgi:uncharacterized protein YndB with AHSA1/START domain
MDPVTVSTTIQRPREEVYAYLADVANHAEFTDHFLVGWRLTSEDSIGLGAGGRFRLKIRGNRFSFGDITLAELEPPASILARGRGGRWNRTRWLMRWELEPSQAGTRVTFSIETQPGNWTDRIGETMYRVGRFHKRGWKRALKRLRAILEDGEQRGVRPTIAGGPRKPATGTPLR